MFRHRKAEERAREIPTRRERHRKRCPARPLSKHCVGALTCIQYTEEYDDAEEKERNEPGRGGARRKRTREERSENEEMERREQRGRSRGADTLCRDVRRPSSEDGGNRAKHKVLREQQVSAEQKNENKELT